MTSKSELGLEDFEAMIAAYGADRTRWPVPRRTAAEALLASSADARRLLGEAEALDRLLARATVDSGVVAPAFLDRVMTAATAQAQSDRVPPAGTRGADVVVLPRAKRPVGPQRAALPPVRRQVGNPWRAAAVLAFALMTGVAMGSLDMFSGPIGGLAEIIGVEMEGEHAVASLQLDSLPVIVDEEHL